MDLGHRGGRQRPGLERGEQLVDGQAEIGFDHRPDGGDVERADLPDAAPGRLRQRRRADAGGGAEQLAELDEHRAEAAEGVDYAGRGRRPPRLPLGAGQPPGEGPGETHDEDPADRDEPAELSEAEGGQRRRVDEQRLGRRAVGIGAPEGAPLGD